MAAPCYCSWRFMTCPFILAIMWCSLASSGTHRVHKVRWATCAERSPSGTDVASAQVSVRSVATQGNPARRLPACRASRNGVMFMKARSSAEVRLTGVRGVAFVVACSRPKATTSVQPTSTTPPPTDKMVAPRHPILRTERAPPTKTLRHQFKYALLDNNSAAF